MTVVRLIPFIILAAGAAAQPRSTDRRVAGDKDITYTLIGVGDSLTHGTMDGTNNSINTLNAYLEKVAESLGESVTLRFSQPLFNERGERERALRVPTNVGVDGADVFSIEGLDYFLRIGAAENVLYDGYFCDERLPFRLESTSDKVMYPINLIARAPVTQVDAAVELTQRYAPETGDDRAVIVLWIGNNDSSSAALGSGGENPTFIPVPFEQIDPEIKGSLRLLANVAKEQGILSTDAYTMASIERNMTLLSDFESQYAHVLDRLRSESTFAAGRVDILLLTLPYYSSIGYLMDSEDIEYYLRKLNPAYAVPPTFARVAPDGQPIVNPLLGDRISLLTFGFMYSLLHTGYSVDYVNQVLETGGVRRDDMVLSQTEQAFIRARIDGFNDTIRDLAAASPAHVHLIDIDDVLNRTLTGEEVVEVGGRPFTRKWTRGGAFSLDGVHPGYVGQSYIANHVVNGINRALGMNAPQIDLEQVFLSDPYIDHDGDGWAPGPDYPAHGITEILFFLTDANDADPTTGAVLPPDLWNQLSDAMLDEVLGVSPIRRLALELGIVESP